jgi:hypothetical protein
MSGEATANRHSRKERMLHFEHTLLNADRAAHHQWPLPFRTEHGVQHEEWNPSAMVAMNVSADNRVDRVVIDAEHLERDTRERLPGVERLPDRRTRAIAQYTT